MNNLIYVITHKDAIFPNKIIYKPMLVGAYKNKISIEAVKDNVGENISEKNSSYCELTGLYWMWKHANCDNIGLAHYRRYFFEKFFVRDINKVLSGEKIEEILNKYDIIVPKKVYSYYKVKDNYSNLHYAKDWEILKRVVEEDFPEYLSSFEIVEERKWLYPYNMFIMSDVRMNDYCEWLFKILGDVECKIDISEYDNYNKRIFGFMSERLFNVWVLKNKCTLKEEYVVNVDNSYVKEFLFEPIRNFICKLIK